ncbi:MAG: VRR-NUC domain-containing protein [Faecalibacterium prausnitzii]|nr:VRR-NUC domain-containing protein [Faecalibacterium prausnitzii]
MQNQKAKRGVVKLESSIERQLKRTVEGLEDRIMCLKFESPGMSGVPDRVILLPGGHTVFVELKQAGKHERARQEYVQQKIRDAGFAVFSGVDSPEKIRQVADYCRYLMDQDFFNQVADDPLEAQDVPFEDRPDLWEDDPCGIF